jgi:hypothetical protein
MADGTFTFNNATLSDGVTTQVCESLTIHAQGCVTVAHAPNQLGLVNVSIRGRVGTGDDVVILGFIIPNGPPRSVTIVARGPSLAAHGVVNPLQDPTLTVVDGFGRILDKNDSWTDPARVDSITGSGHAPKDQREAATVLTLEPGAYTAIMDGQNGGTGVGIIELFPR